MYFLDEVLNITSYNVMYKTSKAKAFEVIKSIFLVKSRLVKESF